MAKDDEGLRSVIKAERDKMIEDFMTRLRGFLLKTGDPVLTVYVRQGGYASGGPEGLSYGEVAWKAEASGTMNASEAPVTPCRVSEFPQGTCRSPLD
jgi:hypothetical protein